MDDASTSASPVGGHKYSTPDSRAVVAVANATLAATISVLWSAAALCLLAGRLAYQGGTVYE